MQMLIEMNLQVYFLKRAELYLSYGISFESCFIKKKAFTLKYCSVTILRGEERAVSSLTSNSTEDAYLNEVDL